MKYRGVLEIVILIVLLVLLVKVDLHYDPVKAKNYIGMSNQKEVITLNSSDAVLSEDNSNDVSTIEYTNDLSSATSIGISNIELICQGTGKNKEDDEKLVKNNLKLYVYFTLSDSTKRYESIVLNKGEKVYIHIEKKYIGETYPQSDVRCQYNIST